VSLSLFQASAVATDAVCDRAVVVSINVTSVSRVSVAKANLLQQQLQQLNSHSGPQASVASSLDHGGANVQTIMMINVNKRVYCEKITTLALFLTVFNCKRFLEYFEYFAVHADAKFQFFGAAVSKIHSQTFTTK